MSYRRQHEFTGPCYATLVTPLGLPQLPGLKLQIPTSEHILQLPNSTQSEYSKPQEAPEAQTPEAAKTYFGNPQSPHLIWFPV